MERTHGFWTEDKIKVAARKFKNRTDFRNKQNGAYNAARRKEILDEVCGHMKVNSKPIGYWTKEKVLKVCKKFKSIKEVRECEPMAYQYAYKLKIADEAFENLKSNRDKYGYWNKQTVKKEAKKYKTIMGFKRAAGGAYLWAYHNNFLEELKKDFEEIRRLESSWTKKEIIKLAKTYKMRKEFYTKEKKAYRVAKKRGWLEDVYKFLEMGKISEKKRAIYAFEFPDKSVYVGLTNDYNIRYKAHVNSKNSKIKKKTDEIGHEFIMFNEWFPPDMARTEEQIVLDSYIRRGWKVINIAKAGALGGYTKYWTLERLKEVAFKFDSRVKFKEEYSGAYSSARRKGLLNEVLGHIELKAKGRDYWTDELIHKIAKQYKTRVAFKKGNAAAYSAAQRYGLLKKVTKHMTRLRQLNNLNSR